MYNYELYTKWLLIAKDFDNKRLVDEVGILERLCDNDDFINSFFIDEANDMLDAFKDECVNRISMYSK